MRWGSGTSRVPHVRWRMLGWEEQGTCEPVFVAVALKLWHVQLLPPCKAAASECRDGWSREHSASPKLPLDTAALTAAAMG